MNDAMSNARFFYIENSFEKILKPSAKPEISMNKTAQRQKILAQIEATLSREENQKLSEKFQKT